MIKEFEAGMDYNAEVAESAVLVDFYSTTCGPCKMLSFVLDDLDKTYGEDVKILKVKFEENPELVEANSVEGYPTLIMYKDGEEVSRKAGLQQKPVIETMIKEAL